MRAAPPQGLHARSHHTARHVPPCLVLHVHMHMPACLALQEEAAARGYRVLTPLVSLDTPGKATVQVVILADPDGHEVSTCRRGGVEEGGARGKAFHVALLEHRAVVGIA